MSIAMNMPSGKNNMKREMKTRIMSGVTQILKDGLHTWTLPEAIKNSPLSTPLMFLVGIKKMENFKPNVLISSFR